MFIFPKNPKNKGFTLIELIVVIAIIGVLGSVVMSSLNSARAKSRDARRKIDLQQIRTAINMYYNDHGNYFNSNSGCGYKGTGWGFLIIMTEVFSIPSQSLSV
jgi:prepilin-type N-terminal cleavage/methylation domain-containing protein